MSDASRSAAQYRPVVVIVGAGTPLKDGLGQALWCQGIQVETASVARAQEAVVRAAPDLVVLVGDATEDAGIMVLDRLGASQTSSAVPAVVLGETLTVDERLAALRHGAAAVVSRSLDAVATAVRVAGFLREIPDRTRQTFERLGERALRDFADEMSAQFRAKLLTRQSSRSDPGAQLVFGGGRALAKLVDEFIHRRGRPCVVGDTEDLDLACADSRRSAVDSTHQQKKTPAADTLAGLRVGLADNDTARADDLARKLQARGATVLVVDLSPSSDQRLAPLQELDPSVVVIGQRQLWDELLRRMYRDVGLRWATLLVVEWEQLGSGPEQGPALEQLASRLLKLTEAERDLQHRLGQSSPFNIRLESIGPSRLLRALCESNAAVRVAVQARRSRVELELSGGHVVRAAASGPREGLDILQRPAALTLLAGLESGRVTIAPIARDTAAEPAATVETAPIVVIQEREATATVPAWPSPEPAREPVTVKVQSDTHALDAGWTSGEAATATAPRTDGADRAITFRSRQTDGTRPGTGHGEVPASLQPVARSGSVPAGRQPRLSRRATVVAGLAGLAAAVVGFAHLRGQPAVVSTAPPSPAAATRDAGKNAAIETPPPASAPSASAGEDRPPPERKTELPATTNPTAPSCEDLLGATQPPTSHARARSRAAVRRGRLGLVHGQLRIAQREFCRAVRADPSYISGQQELAELLLFVRDGNAGLAQVRRALEIDPENRGLHGLHGDALARLGRYAEARRAWLAGAQLDNGSGADRKLTGKFLRAARRFRYAHAWGEAERLYRRVVVIDPSNVEASAGLAQALRGLGQPDEARRWFDYVDKLSQRGEGSQEAKELGTAR